MNDDADDKAQECPKRYEGGPHRWEPGAPGDPDWCYYCEALRAVLPGGVEGAVAKDRVRARSRADDKAQGERVLHAGECEQALAWLRSGRNIHEQWAAFIESGQECPAELGDAAWHRQRIEGYNRVIGLLAHLATLLAAKGEECERAKDAMAHVVREMHETFAERDALWAHAYDRKLAERDAALARVEALRGEVRAREDGRSHADCTCGLRALLTDQPAATKASASEIEAAAGVTDEDREIGKAALRAAQAGREEG